VLRWPRPANGAGDAVRVGRRGRCCCAVRCTTDEFGDVIVDQPNVTDRFPRLSLLTGLFANAWVTRTVTPKPGALQARIEFAARWDVAPVALVELSHGRFGPTENGREGLDDAGRTGASRGWARRQVWYHQPLPPLLANGVYSAATLLGPETATVEGAGGSAARAVRPCSRAQDLPAGEPLLRGVMDAADVLAALRATSPDRARARNRLERLLAGASGSGFTGRVVAVYDRRDCAIRSILAGACRRRGLLPIGGRMSENLYMVQLRLNAER